MTSLTFTAEQWPFPRWMGPFSPSRGKYSGFRVRQGMLGAWVGSDSGRSFWPVADCQGARTITNVVIENWGGGRILILPNGFVVKPLQKDDAVGQRVLIGRIDGALVLRRPDAVLFDLSNPGSLRPGDPWPGPTTIGLECALHADGSLECAWYHPTSLGEDRVSAILYPPDKLLAKAFRDAQKGKSTGRVRITENGFVISNRQEDKDHWMSIFVAKVDTGNLRDWNSGKKQWIGKR